MAGADLDFAPGDRISGFIEYQRASRMATLIEYQCPVAVVEVASHCLDRRLPGIPRGNQSPPFLRHDRINPAPVLVC